LMNLKINNHYSSHQHMDRYARELPYISKIIKVSF